MNFSAGFRAACAWHRSTRALLAFGYCAVAAALAAPASAQGAVWTVGPAGLMPDVQTAVDAAATGDFILVDPGTYAGFTIDAKSLTVVTRVDVSLGESVAIDGEVLIQNLASGDLVVLQGDAFKIKGTVGHAVEVRNSLGSVRIQGLELEGACGVAGVVGWSGLVLDHASDVGVFRTIVKGGVVCDYPGDGGTAIQITASNAALYDVTATGANGVDDLANLGSSGTSGGSGASVWSGFLFASRSTFQGGDGANGSDGFLDCATGGIEPGSGGDGGHGIMLADATALARVMDTQRNGGAAGLVGAGALCTAGDGAVGLPDSLGAGATLVDDPVPSRIMVAPNLAHELSAIDFHFEGEIGDRVYMFLSGTAGFVDEPLFSGVTLAQPLYFFRMLMGTIPDTGVLDTTVGVSGLASNVGGAVWHAQTFVRTAAGKRVVGGPATLIVLDSQY